ncbi:MAG: hypothetical protein R3A44_04125, partial [Caldilineaceae bacterium]
MKSSLMYLFMALLASCEFLPFRTAPTGATLELYGNFHTLGVTVSLAGSDDPDQNATATVEYRQDAHTFRTGFPLTRTGPTRFVGSLFWLEPNKPTAVRVTLHDPTDAALDGKVLEATSRTQPEIIVPPARSDLIVSPDGGGGACTLDAPCTLLMGISLAQAGDAVLLRGGVYYQGEITLPRAGEAGAPIIIRSYPGEAAVLDGADPAPHSWTALGGGVYYTELALADTHLVAANGRRLYPYADLAALQNLSWQLPGFYIEGQRLYVHLDSDADPADVAISISRFNRGFNIKTDYIYFLNLTFRHF